MSTASSNWLELPLTPPRWLIPTLMVLALLALVALWISAVPRVAVTLPLLPFGLLLHRLNQLPRGLLHFRDDGGLVWIDEHRREHDMRLIAASARGPLQVLRLGEGKHRFSAIYCRPGNLDATQQRRLTLWLRRHANATATASDTVATP